MYADKVCIQLVKYFFLYLQIAMLYNVQQQQIYIAEIESFLE
jgi:hypothetical protein